MLPSNEFYWLIKDIHSEVDEVERSEQEIRRTKGKHHRLALRRQHTAVDLLKFNLAKLLEELGYE